MMLSPALECLETDLKQVNQTIETLLNTKIGLLNDVFNHMLSAKSKQIRPICALLAARLSGFNPNKHLLHAATMEILHTATLLHDDVIDHADQRRHQPSANQIWGNAPAILTGDFLYAQAFKAMLSLNNMPVMQSIANTTSAMAEGEALQLSYQHQLELNEATYFKIIALKTASLFAATTEISARLANAPIQQQQALKAYGYHFGMAFQLIDDLTDYTNPNPRRGKPAGNDLLEGKMTLPTIYFLQHATATQIQRFKKAFVDQTFKAFYPILKSELIEIGAIDYTLKQAEDHAKKAMVALELFEHKIDHPAAIELVKSILPKETLAA